MRRMGRTAMVGTLLLLSLYGHAQTTLTLQLNNMPMEQAVRQVAAKIGYTVYIDPGVLQHIKLTHLSFQNVSVEQVLHTVDSCLRPYGLQLVYVNKSMSVKGAPNGDLPGHPPQESSPIPDPLADFRLLVLDQSGTPLPGATIINMRTGLQLVTGADGIGYPPHVRLQDRLIISYTGTGGGEVRVTKAGLQSVVLTRETAPLDESVVTGYGLGRRAEQTGSRYTVDRDALSRQPVSNPLAALAGLVPGMVITQTSGIPGASFMIELRGPNSIFNGRDPFILVDGVPFAPNNQSLSHIPSGSAAGSLSPFSFMHITDIEKIEVLKDADATAIYGSRGANGVVIITTRTAKPGAPHWEVSASTGLSQISRRPPLLNTTLYTKMRLEALRNDGIKPDMNSAPDLVGWDTTHSTDWGRYLIGGIGRMTHADVNCYGGNGSTRFLVAGSYTHETNVFPGNPIHVLGTLHGNLQHHSKDSLFSVQVSALGSRDMNNQFINDPSSVQFLAPNAPPLLDSVGNLRFRYNNVYFNNPLAYTKDGYRAESENALLNAILSWRILRPLTLRMNQGFNQVHTDESSVIPISAQDPASAITPTGSAYIAHVKYSSWIVEPQLEFRDTLGPWKLGVLLGGTWEGQRNTIATLSALGFTSDALLHQTSAAAEVDVDHQKLDYHYMAGYVRVHSSWKSRYVVDLTARRDGSSRFGPGNQFGNFGAVGVSWLFGRERSVRAALPFLSFGKLRGSYGTTGNDQIGEFQYLPAFATTVTVPYQGVSGFIPTGSANPNLHWEAIRKLEGAMELGFLQGRLSFTAAWYRNRSSNELLPYYLPLQTGFPSELRNAPAVVQNQGWELSLTTHVIERRKVSWMTVVNWSWVGNKLVAFHGLGNSSYYRDLVIGKSINVVKAYDYTGVDRTSGLFQFRDAHPDGMLNDSDRVVVGSRDVRSFGNISNSLRFGRWQLDCTIEMRLQTGTDYRTDLYRQHGPGALGPGQFGNWTTAISDRWVSAGDQARYQKLSTLRGSDAGKTIANYVLSGAILRSTSFARVKNIALLYTLPAGWLSAMRLSEGSLFVNAENVFTFTRYPGVDPEIHSAVILPPLRTVTVGGKVNFR